MKHFLLVVYLDRNLVIATENLVNEEHVHKHSVTRPNSHPQADRPGQDFYECRALLWQILSIFVWCKELVFDFLGRENRRISSVSSEPEFHPSFVVVVFFVFRNKFSALQIHNAIQTPYFKQKRILLCYYICIFYFASCSVPVLESHISFTVFSLFPSFLDVFKHLSSLFRNTSTSCFLIPIADAALR